MNLAGKRVAILVHNYFEQAEFESPLQALKEMGAEVTVVGADKIELQGMNHVDKGDSFKADILLGEVDTSDFDALVLPGGVVNADSLRMNRRAQEWVDEFMDQSKLIAAICHAPWLLVSTDVIEGRRLTSYHTLKDDIRNAGAEWLDQQVVVDGNLITSRTPDDLPVFNKAIKEWFNSVLV